MYALFFHSGNKHGVCGECRCRAVVALKRMGEWVLVPAIVCPSVWLYLTTHTQPRHWLLVLSSTNCVWSGPLANPWQTWCGVCVCVCESMSAVFLVTACLCLYTKWKYVSLFVLLCVFIYRQSPVTHALCGVFPGMTSIKMVNENLACFIKATITISSVIKATIVTIKATSWFG